MKVYTHRSEIDFKHGTFRVNGDTVDIYLAYSDLGLSGYFLWRMRLKKLNRSIQYRM
ncbi:MAG: hypothetical protein MZV63_40695 [Marinilabiliales bacterium]|nr:hypothetical protein [Marinilabiliales bacterium]